MPDAVHHRFECRASGPGLGSFRESSRWGQLDCREPAGVSEERKPKFERCATDAYSLLGTVRGWPQRRKVSPAQRETEPMSGRDAVGACLQGYFDCHPLAWYQRIAAIEAETPCEVEDAAGDECDRAVRPQVT
ncbi:hypothetical protein HRbin27_00930 [bacterium HR27]|nr:hypothetical protein HRbin27_00930 [bacterium HR27]